MKRKGSLQRATAAELYSKGYLGFVWRGDPSRSWNKGKGSGAPIGPRGKYIAPLRAELD